jgi:hypothetical protein
MSILKDIQWAAAGAAGTAKKTVSAVKGKVQKIQTDRARKTEQANKDMLYRKRKHLPLIQKIARKFTASVEAYDTRAYVSKTVGGREVGVTIHYGESPTNIQLKMDRAFAQRGKELREELGEAGEAIKGAVGDGSGSMYNDPNFGGQFRGSSARAPSRGGKKGKAFADDEESDTHGSSLYPEIRW